MNPITETCPNCGNSYAVGYTGTGDGCDSCLGIIRDDDGYFYEQDEKEILLVGIDTGEVERRKRPGGR